MALTGSKRSVEGTMNEAIDSSDKLEVEVFSGAERALPGLNWELSQSTQDAIKAIDANIRAAEQISGKLAVG